MLDGCTPYPLEFIERYLRQGHWRSETIVEAVLAAAAANRDNLRSPVVIDAYRRLGYPELLEWASSMAGVLADGGVGRGDRVIVQVPNCADFAAVMLACIELGAIPLMVLPALRRAELEHLAAVSQAAAIIVRPTHRGFDHVALARELQSAVPSLGSIFSLGPASGATDLNDVSSARPRTIGSSANDPFDIALMLLSGGTTGLPKLIPRTHADFLSGARASAVRCGVGVNARILFALPIEHNFALGAPGLVGSLAAGATAILTDTTTAADLAAIIESEKVTHLPCVPTIAASLLALPDHLIESLASLRVLTIGGQRLQEPVARALRAMFPHVKVQQVLGMSEGMLFYTGLDANDDLACTTQGRPASEADEIRIVGTDGSNVLEGMPGELWCRGPSTIRGYYRATRENLEAFTGDGFYRTGDLVRRSPSGNLIVEGRIKDQINRGGEKISADEVELHLISHPAVAAAAVVPMPDERLGQKACAYVTLRAGEALTLDGLREFLSERGLARYKWPERLEMVDAMPLTNVGKIKRAELRRWIEARVAAERSESANG